MTKSKIYHCYYCKAVLSDDDNLVHFAIDGDEVDALGLNDVSEVGNEHAVYIFLCSVCGTRAMAPTVAECKRRAAEYEAEQEAKRPLN